MMMTTTTMKNQMSTLEFVLFKLARWTRTRGENTIRRQTRLVRRSVDWAFRAVDQVTTQSISPSLDLKNRSFHSKLYSLYELPLR